MTPGLLAEARRVLHNKERVERHERSERVRSVDGVMATVTPPEQLTWSRTLCWSLAHAGPDGKPKVSVRTTLAQIREFYEWRMSLDLPGEMQLGLSDVRSSWYVLHEAPPTRMYDVNTRELTRIIDSAVLFALDGREGISSEIVWLRSADVSLDAPAKHDRWRSYLAALREQDPAKIVALMSAGVQGAVRDYVDADPPFVAIDGGVEMRTHWERFFRRFDLRDVSVAMNLVRDWFVFHELVLTVRVREGRDSGRELACRIAEYMPFDSDGSFQGRCGYGTGLEPLPA